MCNSTRRAGITLTSRDLIVLFYIMNIIYNIYIRICCRVEDFEVEFTTPHPLFPLSRPLQNTVNLHTFAFSQYGILDCAMCVFPDYDVTS